MEKFFKSASCACVKFTGNTYAGKLLNTAKSFSVKNNVKVLELLTGHAKNFAKYFYKVLPFVLLLLLNISAINAQNDISYALHANIIYRFTKYIEWPGNAPGDFVIGILGDSPLYEELVQFTTNKTVAEKRITIKKMYSSADALNCQILFISDDKNKSIKKITEVTKGTPTLIVSESNGMASKGSCINFVVVNEHLKLEINKNNILEHNLNIATELLSLGTVVK